MHVVRVRITASVRTADPCATTRMALIHRSPLNRIAAAWVQARQTAAPFTLTPWG